MAGLTVFALMTLVTQLSIASAGVLSLGPNGFRLLLHAAGSTAVAIGLPRFVVSAFGGSLRRTHAIALYSFVLAILVLTVARAIVGWSGSPEPDRLGFLIRILNFVVLGGALGSIVVFQARLPDRSLFRTVLTQLGALVLLLPLVYLEDVAVFSVPGFPHLAGQILMVSVAVSAILHAAHSLMRPRYVEQNQVSDYFVSHFFVSAREKEVVECVFQGLDTRAIAEKLFISHRTVEKHLSNVYQKTGVSNRIQLYQLLRSDVS